MDPEVVDILNKVKSGELSAEEGAQRLQSLEFLAGIPADSEFNAEMLASPQPVMPPHEEPLPDLGWWKNIWMVPFGIGTVVIVLSAIWMGSAYTNQSFFWFYCSWLPMLLGVLVLLLGWWGQQARWVHVRIKDADGTRVAISLPIPLRLAGWLLHTFGRFIPNMDPRALENLPAIFAALAREKGPTSVEVDEKDGTCVRVYII